MAEKKTSSSDQETGYSSPDYRRKELDIMYRLDEQEIRKLLLRTTDPDAVELIIKAVKHNGGGETKK